MRRILSLLAACLALAAAAPPPATKAASWLSDVEIGAGVSFDREYLLGITAQQYYATGSNIYLPITFARSIRVEPEIGVIETRQRTEYFESVSSNWRFGIGVMKLFDRDDTRIYAGLRLGVLYWGSFTELAFSGESSEDSRTDVSLGPCLGAEHLFGEHFGLGGEAQISYVWFGDWESKDKEMRDASFLNRTLLFVRWYF